MNAAPRSARTEPAITPGQIKMIKIAAKAKGLDDTTYRKMLIEHFGVSSCTKLTTRQARIIIDLITGKRCWVCAPRPKREKLSSTVTVLASPDQLHIIEDLRHAHSWAWNPVRYHAWLKKRMHMDRVVTSPQATQVIEALKAMIQAEKKCACTFNRDNGEGTL